MEKATQRKCPSKVLRPAPKPPVSLPTRVQQSLWYNVSSLRCSSVHHEGFVHTVPLVTFLHFCFHGIHRVPDIPDPHFQDQGRVAWTNGHLQVRKLRCTVRILLAIRLAPVCLLVLTNLAPTRATHTTTHSYRSHTVDVHTYTTKPQG